MADKDPRGEQLAIRLSNTERAFCRQMAADINPDALDAARRSVDDAEHLLQAHLDGRCYGFGIRERRGRR